MPATAAMLAISIGSGIVQNQASQKAKGVAGALAKTQADTNAALIAKENTAAADQAQASMLAGQAQAEQLKKTLGAPGRASTIRTGPMGSITPPPGARQTLLGL